MRHLIDFLQKWEGQGFPGFVSYADLLPCHIVLVDDTYCIRYQNKMALKLFGQVVGQFCYQVFHGRTSPCEQCGENKGNSSIQGASPIQEDWEYVSSKGVYRAFRFDFSAGQKNFILKVGLPISEQTVIHEMPNSPEVATAGLRLMGRAVLGENWEIISSSELLDTWWQEPLAGHLVCDLFDCIHYKAGQDTTQCPECVFIRALRRGSLQKAERRVVFPDKIEKMLRLAVYPLQPGEKNAVCILLVEDITRPVHPVEQFDSICRLESVETFAAGMAHELNQPLSAIQLYAGGLEILLERHKSLRPTVIQERMQLILEQVQKIREIIDNMRSLVLRDDAISVEPFCLKTGIEQVVLQMQAKLAEEGVLLRLVVPDRLPFVYGSLVQFEQVLGNLITNAVQAIKHTTASTDMQPAVRLSVGLEENRECVSLTVADTGPGLQEDAEKLFRPFFTTKVTRENMGLGLPISRSFVELWGGHITAQTNDPELGGAAFTLFLRKVPPAS